MELQEWAKSTLDEPVRLIDDLDPDHPDPDRCFQVPSHELVDIGGLDVLLNACKPTLLDAKPPIRLNVIQESNPPEALVKNLKKTLGVKLDKKANNNQNPKHIRGFQDIDSSFTYKPRIVKPRPKVYFLIFFLKPGSRGVTHSFLK